MVGLSQELLLSCRDMRESVRGDLSSLLLRETGSNELVKQRNHMVETGRAIGRRRRRRVNDQRSTSTV